MIETTSNKVIYDITDASVRVFAFGIPFYAASDIHCYYYLNTVETELTASQFSVEQKSDYSSGANITLLFAPAVGARLSIERQLPLTQTLDLPLHGKIPSTALENQLDRLIMICQQLKEITSRSFAVPHGMEATQGTYEAFQKLVQNAETWANQASAGAASAAVSATAAASSASSASSSASSAGNSSSAASVSAVNAASSATSARSDADMVEQLAYAAGGNHVGLAFGDWSASGSGAAIVDYGDWTPLETLGSLNSHNSDTAAHPNGFGPSLTVSGTAPALELSPANHLFHFGGELAYSGDSASGNVSLRTLATGYTASLDFGVNTSGTAMMRGRVFSTAGLETGTVQLYGFTANTPAAGDNTTKIATTAFVKTHVDAAILDALDDTVLTGTPTAPTVASLSDSSTKIATTAFVQNLCGKGLKAANGYLAFPNGVVAEWGCAAFPANAYAMDVQLPCHLTTLYSATANLADAEYDGTGYHTSRGTDGVNPGRFTAGTSTSTLRFYKKTDAAVNFYWLAIGTNS